MQEQENEVSQENSEKEERHQGGAAPEHRRCHYTRTCGERCRDWTIRGQKYCARHERYLNVLPDKPIDVPLLEDEASVVLLLSETLRAMAWGTLPTANGQILLAGCRLASALQMQKLEVAKFRLRVRRMGIREEELFEAHSGSSQGQGSESWMEECGSDEKPTRAEGETEPAAPTTSISKPGANYRFRDLKKNWDKELRRAEKEITDMWAPREGETREEFNAARATPFDGLIRERGAIGMV